MNSLHRLKEILDKREQTLSEERTDSPVEENAQSPEEVRVEDDSLRSRLQNVVERERTITTPEESDSGDFGPDLEEVRLQETLLAEEYGSKGKIFQRATSFFSKTTFWLCLLAGGLLAFYMYVQALSLWGSVQTLPAILRYPAIGVFAALVLFVAIAALRLTGMYFSRRANRQVQLRSLQERENLQKMSCLEGGGQITDASFASLLEFVRSYPTDDFSPHLRSTKSVNMPKWQAFQENLVKLCKLPNIADSEAFPNRREWIQEFQNVQKYLDDCAQRRLDAISKIVALKTAISPYPLWDMLIVLFWSFQFLTELCRMYNLRIDNYGTARLLLELWITAFCSAKIDGAEEYTQAAAEQSLSGLVSNPLAKTILGNVSSKTVSGLANYYLFRRLGRQAIRRIRPLDMPE